MSGLPYEEICLAAIGEDQAAVKQIDYALSQVVKNIADPNTDPVKKRSVTLKIEFKPEQSRKSAEITFSVETKLAGDMPGSDHVTISADGTGVVPMFDQLKLPVEPRLTAKDGGEK
jgi:hypothetical protein